MRPMHRQVLLLAIAQALFQIVSVLVMTIGGLAGSILAPAPQFATAPIAAMFLGTAVSTVPASMWMTRVGRKTGFVTGAVLGTLGGLVAAAGMLTSSLALLCFGTFLAGAYQGFAQFYRFAASEVADEGFKPRAISLVLAGGVVAALLGPLLARVGGDGGTFLVRDDRQRPEFFIRADGAARARARGRTDRPAAAAAADRPPPDIP